MESPTTGPGAVPCELEILDLSSEPNPLDISSPGWKRGPPSAQYRSLPVRFSPGASEDRQHAWFFNQHHIITDASSFFLPTNVWQNL
jgi:hypothetical protein